MKVGRGRRVGGSVDGDIAANWDSIKMILGASIGNAYGVIILCICVVG